MDSLNWISYHYKSLRENADPRIKHLPLVDSPVVPSLLISAYLLFIYLGPKWMANRKPFEMKNMLIGYNFSMVLLNVYVVQEMLLGGWLFEYSIGCQPVDNSPSGVRMAYAVWLFFIAKYVELLDTIFFILRKKNNQVTFLHVFHHGCLPLFWWWGVRAVPGGFGTFHALVNAMVHVVMYFYYGMTALGPKYYKYLWWKRYVTVFQLAQFFIVTLHNSQYLFIECAFPWPFVAFIQAFTTIVAALFLNFYIRTYRKPSALPDKKHRENGSVSNGHAHKTGYANGNLGNGYNGSVSNGHAHKTGYANGNLGNGYTNGHVQEIKRRPLKK